MDRQRVAAAIERQVSQHNGYEGGQIEHLEAQVDSLQKAVGVLAAMLLERGLVTVQELNDEMPSYGYGTIADDLHEKEEPLA